MMRIGDAEAPKPSPKQCSGQQLSGARGPRCLFDNEASAKHAHGASKGEFAGLLWHQLDGNGLAGGEICTLLEVGEDYLVRTGRRFLPAKVQPDRPTRAHDDRVWRVAAFNQDHGLLIPSARLRGADALRPLQPEEPDDESDEQDTRDGHAQTVGTHQAIPFDSNRRKRLALVTTVTELNAIAAAAINGDSRRPMKG